ncbi:MAG: endonuclease/exonuclease/phosphatase family protein [Chloroflexota bacterium]|nr:MAG: endonuclease/exonuclease/phosphatase family protein [Chloroflexota bacterium]
MASKSRKIRCQDLVAVAGAYLLILFSWLGVYLATGDRFTVIALLNFVAIFLFVPLALVLLVAITCKSRWLGIGFIIGAAALLWFWGDLFIPRINRNPTTEPTLSVMTYNVLAWHNQYGPILDTIRAENPDVLLLQELNTGLANILQNDLIDAYPYQVLVPVDNPEGIGVISKFPIQPSELTLPQLWAGGPQVLDLDWRGEQITLVNFHMFPTTSILPLDEVDRSIRFREQEAQILAGLANQSESAIMGGDANTTSLSDAYKTITSVLVDAYRSAGFGLGHTFPGSTIPGSDRPHIGWLYVPAWVMRIDYVFHTPDWITVSARTARIDDVSDHRGVIVELAKIK